MFASLWHDFLYQPLFNALIWIYNNWTEENLGWSIVYLTIILRFILLPFTLVGEVNKIKNEQLVGDIKRIDKDFSYDEILKKEEIRKILRQRRVQPWAKAIVLGIQALVLVLLYQVFVRGITGERLMQILYPSIQFPGKINIFFFGFDLSKRYDIIWPGVVAVWLFMENYLQYKEHKIALKKSDLTYLILFPFFVFIVLWWLPLVKSLFILTSMFFSLLVSFLTGIIFKPKKS